MAKIALIVFADTESHEVLGRVVNAFETAKEGKEFDDDIKIVFDGVGTRWIPELSNKNHKIHLLYESVKDKVEGACEYCANAFGVKEELKKLNIPLLNEYDKHPSIRHNIEEGYNVVTF